MQLSSLLNLYGSQRIPFFFCINYTQDQWAVYPLTELPSDIHYTIESKNTPLTTPKKLTDFASKPIDFNTYKTKFNAVQEEIKKGNTYLLNLTSPTQIASAHSLFEIYSNAQAKYKIFYKNQFVSFSPETFIQINKNTIATYPMKGTIEASRDDALQTLLANQKELAEHTMVVDLLRNDLNKVAKNICVEQFRYIDKIYAGKKELLQMSSKITGELHHNWHANIGDILLPLLPAGSITGTPKRKTTELIQSIENYDRGFFTGIWGVYDGEMLDSAVLIRFIEQNSADNDFEYTYKSGGGITLDSLAHEEYNEMLHKIYL